MVFRTPFLRTFFESSLPAWLLLTCLMFVSRGNLVGIFGLLTLLAMLFPGVWGALRLHAPETAWPRRLGYYLVFCLALGLGLALTLLATRFALFFLGLYGIDLKTNELGKLLPFGVTPGITFLIVRGGVALPKIIRRWGGRGRLKRLAGAVVLIGLLVALGGGIYWWASQPYAGHTSWSAPYILTSATLTDFSQNADGWQVTDPAVQMQIEKGMLRLSYSVSPAMSYSVTWQLQSGHLSQANGLQLSAYSDIATSLLMEVEEAGGSRYRSWADLTAGGKAPLFFIDFLPSLETLDENNHLDWEQIERLTIYVYPETANADFRLDKIEAVTLEETSWQMATDQHFWIRYHATDQGVVADVQRAAENQFESLAATLGYKPIGRIPITIVSTHAELEQQVGRSLPAWVVGTATPDSLAILTPKRFSPLFNNRSYETVFELVPHELTHLLIVQRVGYPGFMEMPGWLNEGLATYLAGQSRDVSVLRNAAKQGKLPTLQDLDKAFSGQAAVGDDYYTVAGSITAYLIETYGIDKVPLLLEALAKGGDFDTELEQVIGIDRDTLEQQWRELLVTDDK